MHLLGVASLLADSTGQLDSNTVMDLDLLDAFDRAATRQLASHALACLLQA